MTFLYQKSRCLIEAILSSLKASTFIFTHNYVWRIKKYNIYTLITKISALNLIPYNQTKSLILDTYIEFLLTQSIDCYNSKYNISFGKFRSLINQIANSPLKTTIDPAENLFVQNIMFFGNYRVLNGIDITPSYNLQQIIDVLFVNKDKKYNFSFLNLAYMHSPEKRNGSSGLTARRSASVERCKMAVTRD